MKHSELEIGRSPAYHPGKRIQTHPDNVAWLKSIGKHRQVRIGKLFQVIIEYPIQGTVGAKPGQFHVEFRQGVEMRWQFAEAEMDGRAGYRRVQGSDAVLQPGNGRLGHARVVTADKLLRNRQLELQDH
jgi:hypothetical protein